MKFNVKIHIYPPVPVLFLCLVPALLLLPVRAMSADVWDELNEHEFQLNEDVEEYIWQEEGMQLPEYPQDVNLLEVAGPAAYRNYQYLIDGKTLQVGKDGVVRYSMVIRSPGGADNVMFEGLRCNSGQIKNYAYGGTDKMGKKVFLRRENAKWKPIRSIGVTGYSQSLRANYFCDMKGAILTRHEIIQNIKYGKGNVDGLYY